MVDVSDIIEPEQMPLCPLCDNAILDWEPVVLVTCGGSKGLAHSDCVEHEEKNASEDE